MGVVWRAVDRADGQVVALKVLRAESPGPEADGQPARAAERFVREARALSEVRHPGVVRYVAHGATQSGERWLAMEWVDGEGLKERLKAGPLTVRESVALAARLADALSALHAKSVVHRDVKPSNVVLPAGDVAAAKLLDFGVARFATTGGGMTRTGTRVGTPGYMAPEQARGDRDVDSRADVFALGCVLFQCLTGRAPFLGDHEMAVLAKILLEDAPLASEITQGLPRPLVDLVARMLSKAPELRPRDGAAVSLQIAALGEMETLDDGSSSKGMPRAPPAVALGKGERRLVSVVLAGPAAKEREQKLRDVAEAHGARVERLAGGAVLAVLSGTGAATDQATRAARLALAMQGAAPEVPMALATGRAEVAGDRPVGEVVDRTATLLRTGAEGPPVVRVDEITAGLLGARFDVQGDAAGLVLTAERAAGDADAARTLLGKPTPFVGREPEIGLLSSVFEVCASEPVARALVLTGPAGVGKTRLASEFVRRLAGRGEPAEVWIARGDPMTAGSPFALLGQAIRAAAGVRDGEPLAIRRKKVRARVSRNAPGDDVQRIAEFLGEIAGVQFAAEKSVQLRSARRDAMLMGEQMRRAWEDFLRIETAVQPVVLVLENLHWGDQPTVGLVDVSLRRLRDRPLLVLALARPEFREIFPTLWAERSVQEIRLTELTPRACEKLVRGVLGETVGQDAAARIVERSAGNPFYLEELIRAQAAGPSETPGTVLAMVQARLESLPDEARRVLRAASVFGQTFWTDGVASLLGVQAVGDVARWLGDLADGEVVVRRGESRFPGEEEYGFRHALVREAAHAMLTEADDALGHRLAGQWLQRAGENDAALLAEHFERGGEGARAAEFWSRAAEHALDANDFARTIALSERGVRCGASQALLGTLRLHEASARRWRGEHALALAPSQDAMDLLPRGSAPWQDAVQELASASAKIGRREVLASAAEALLVTPGDDRGAHVVALADTARVLFHAGFYDLAARLVARMEELGDEALADPGAWARIHRTRATRALYAGDAAAYLKLQGEAAKGFEESGDLRTARLSRVNQGYALMGVGRYAEAEAVLRAVVAAAEGMGTSYAAAVGKQNLGMAIARQGRHAEGLAMLHESVAVLHAQGDVRMEGASRDYLAIANLLAGDLEGAHREASAAVSGLTFSPLRAQALSTLATVEMRLGKLEQALAHTREAMDLLQKLGGLEEGESNVRLAWAEALHASGDLEAARAAIAAARDRLAERATKIGDESMRQSFLEAVPDNARTMALASAWGA